VCNPLRLLLLPELFQLLLLLLLLLLLYCCH
jgi:hypothetical protein